jgi:hypothetical protein
LKRYFKANKLRTQEHDERKKHTEIKKNNEKLLGKIVEISKGNQSSMNQKNMKVPKAVC